MNDVIVSEDGRQLSLVATDRRLRFHAIWLRDNAWDAQTRSARNGQRLLTLAEIPVDTHISAATAVNGELHITFCPENTTLRYTIDWLISNAYDRPQANSRGWIAAELETWDNALAAKLPQADFHDVHASQATLKIWLGQVARYGFAKLNNGPIEDRALMRVVDLFGYVRETNYGKHFEVRSTVNASNLAYTGLALQAHTDNPYRDPVPSIQVLYCLESSAAGGENMVVDGFRVAERLRQENALWFDMLSRYCARFEFTGEAGVCLRARRPMIELAPDGELIGIRFNNRSAAATTEVPFDQMPDFYAACRRMGELIDDPAMQVSFRLEPGDSFVVDNTRVLHARKAYSGTGSRWLQGCYADKDSLLSTLACIELDAVEVAR